MEFKNLTPFQALAYSAFNVHDEEHHVVALRAVYKLESGEGARGLGGVPLTHRCEFLLDDPAAAKLRTRDVYEGEVHASSVREESDIAPFKPRCDVLVRATAHAPNGVPTARWQSRVRVTDAAQGVVVDKTLDVCGPRWFESAGGAWSLTDAEPALRVPMRWEHAFGGACKVPHPDAVDGAENNPTELLNEVCFTNPVGCGWIESRYFSALREAGRSEPTRLPAPQITRPGETLSAPYVAEHPPHAVEAPRMAELAAEYSLRPAGIGPVGRAWTPRLQKAGSFDEFWLEKRHPFLPEDFSFAYWNAAPEDQQIAFPAPGLQIELWNLADAARTVDGYLSFALPPHRAFVMAYVGGLPVPVPASLDTVHVDVESMTVACVWRVLVSRALRIATMEARFEVDPAAPLLKLEEV